MISGRVKEGEGASIQCHYVKLLLQIQSEGYLLFCTPLRGRVPCVSFEPPCGVRVQRCAIPLSFSFHWLPQLQRVMIQVVCIPRKSRRGLLFVLSCFREKIIPGAMLSSYTLPHLPHRTPSNPATPPHPIHSTPPFPSHFTPLHPPRETPSYPIPPPPPVSTHSWFFGHAVPFEKMATALSHCGSRGLFAAGALSPWANAGEH